MYCGKQIIVERAVKASADANVGNLMALANSAIEAQNGLEAYAYFTKVLEYDGTNVEAWLGKGKAAGMISTLQNLRFTEMNAAFQNAIKYGPDADPSVRQTASKSINEFAMITFAMARDSLSQYIALEHTWSNYLQQCLLILEGLDFAQEIWPKDRQYFDNAVSICADNIRGRTFSDPYHLDSNGNPISKAVFLSPEYKTLMEQRLNRYVEKLTDFDPGYQLPNHRCRKTCGMLCSFGGYERPSCSFNAANLSRRDSPTAPLGSNLCKRILR